MFFSLVTSRRFSPIAFSHWIIDLATALSLSNTTLGLVSSLAIILPGLSQPFFGWLADRLGGRWVMAGGVLWMASFYLFTLFIPGEAALIFLVLGSLGSGMFHAAGSAQATVAGREAFPGRDTTPVSIFTLFGQLGYLTGPLLAGVLLDRWGGYGLILPCSVGIAIGALAAFLLNPNRHTPAAGAAEVPPEKAARPARQMAWNSILALFGVAVFQAWASQNITIFMPKFVADLGQPASVYGLLLPLFTIGGVFGNVVSASLADRIGRARFILIVMLASVLPVAGLAMTGYSAWMYLLLPLYGAGISAAFPVIVALAQRLVPGGMGMVTGLVLGILFSSGALGTMVSGALADAVGFLPVFWLTAGLALLGGLCALGIKE
jgi:FSR family fosmidomycin resistance protein-like MFS transporter